MSLKPHLLALASFGKANPATWEAAEDDEAWFARNRYRTFRLRRARSGEFPNPDGTHVLVAKLKPGVIARHSFANPGFDPDDTDCQGEALWQRWGNPPLSKKWGPKIALIRAEAEGSA